jgi:hypothetical protein
VLNDVYREAGAEVIVDGVVVGASGRFDPETWARTGIEYDVSADSQGDPDAVARLLDAVERVAEIPRVVSGEVEVSRR